MTDRVYPSKPKSNTNTKTTAAATTTGKPNRILPPPPNKTTPTTTTTRHPYRPNPTTTTRRRRSRRGCFCLCCFWSILIIILLLLIAAIAGCIFYLLYHPHRPSFSIAALKISEFNLTTTPSDDTTHLTSKLNLTLSTRNPNKKITFCYNSITITCSSHDTIIAKGTYPFSITSKPSNITIIHSSLHIISSLLEPETVNKFRSDLKKKSGLPLSLVLDTEARVKVETFKTKKVGIRIKCEGIHSLIPKGGHRNSSAVAASVDGAKCKLDLRIKIWKWTF